ncbi:MAG: crossover junction endodeoxyribonuclease RuvC [Pseudomonadota bacterium]
MRILGIDPGSRVTGYGIVDALPNSDPIHVANGCIRVGDGEFSSRLHGIYTAVAELVARFQPTEVAIERVFVSRNVDSALKLGQARGAALCATFVGEAVPAVYEYSAREIKQAVAGRGGAEKTQVQAMVRLLLDEEGPLQADAADALAAALCRAYVRRTEQRLGVAVESTTGARAASRSETQALLREAWASRGRRGRRR